MTTGKTVQRLNAQKKKKYRCFRRSTASLIKNWIDKGINQEGR